MIDCNDLDAMSTFWCAALGLEEKGRYPSYVWLSRLSDGGPSLALQQVPEPRSGKNRIHLDVMAKDPAAFADHIISLGGSRVEDHEAEGFHWTVLADPEGNVFCVSPADH
jgi:catechol 2,3-dioxygenase-like lactoylglutathione lyase family enzyme